MSKYGEIRINFYDEDEQKWFVDAWETPNDNEDGTVIAKIDDAGHVEYLDGDAKTDTYAQEEIRAKINELETEVNTDRLKRYYLAKYQKLYNSCLDEVAAENPADVFDGASTLFEECAGPEEVVGYYINFYGEDAKKVWEQNIEFMMPLTAKDYEVSRLLASIY